MIYVWLAVVILSIVVEAVTNELLTIWFAIAGLICVILSAFQIEWYITLPVFIAVSMALILGLRKISIKLLNKKCDDKTNADAVFGKKFVLLSKISLNQPGTIKVNDVVWNVLTENNGEVVEEGSLVKVLRLSGNKYIVEPIINEEQH